jgi:hypothetical protein
VHYRSHEFLTRRLKKRLLRPAIRRSKNLGNVSDRGRIGDAEAGMEDVPSNVPRNAASIEGVEKKRGVGTKSEAA